MPLRRDITVSRFAVTPDTGHAGVGAFAASTGSADHGVRCHGPAGAWCSRLLAVALALVTTGVVAVECHPQGTRFERNYCAALEARAAELALVDVRERTRAALAADPHALAAFERANRAWADYVDATLATAHPCAHDDLALCYGEGTPACVARLRARLAGERHSLLEDLLVRSPGPDNCD